MASVLELSDSAGPLFIVGNSRSGTTLVARMLSKHSDIYISGETHYFQNVVDMYFGDNSEKEPAELLRQMEVIQKYGIYRKDRELTSSSLLGNAFTKGEIDSSNKYKLYHDVLRVIGKSHGKHMVGDQTPQNVFYVDELVSAYPSVKIINMVRDPRAVILSQRGKWKVAKKLGLPLKEVIRSFFNYHPVTLSILWNQAVSAGLAAEQKYGNAKVHTVIFERLVSYPQETMASLCNYVGVDFQIDMLDVDLQGSSNAPSSGTGREEAIIGVQSNVKDEWRKKLSSGEVALVQLITRRNMKLCGYQSTTTYFPVTIIPLLIYFPIHLFASFLLNIGRVGNPIAYIVKRFRSESGR